MKPGRGVASAEVFMGGDKVRSERGGEQQEQQDMTGVLVCSRARGAE